MAIRFAIYSTIAPSANAYAAKRTIRGILPGNAVGGNPQATRLTGISLVLILYMALAVSGYTR